MSRVKGSYVLLLRVQHELEMAVGGLGTFRFQPGFYAYCGSALSGVESRLARHKRENKRFHWHIDYFLGQVDWVGAWVFPSEQRLECKLFSLLIGLRDATIPAPRFGSSDCGCRSHLVALPGSSSHNTTPTVQERQLARDVIDQLSGQFASASLSFTFEE